MTPAAPPPADFGERVRRLRSALGLSQGELAEAIGVALPTVHRWEAGKSTPRPTALRSFADFEARNAAPTPRPLRSLRLAPPQLDFGGNPDGVAAFAEALFLAHGHEFNPAFATETARIDPLPHQRIAVYERMLSQDPLRFLLADDAGAGKTIMTGLLVRELLSRRRLRRVLIVPPAGLVGNWERELRTLFRLRCAIYGADASTGENPFAGPGGDRMIVSVDTLRQPIAFRALAEPDIAPYDLVVFDEAHKLGVNRQGSRVVKTRRYQLAEALAAGAPGGGRFAGLGWTARHLLLLTATPHMGRDLPWFHLWRLLDSRVFSTGEAVRRLPDASRSRYFLRRTKEEMVDLDGAPLYLRRHCDTLGYALTDGEAELYERTTDYLTEFYGKALSNRPAVELALSVFQRRLASSTWALLRSFERRIEKLGEIVRGIESGDHDLQALAREQSRSAGLDFFDAYAADEETSEAGREASEAYEDEVLGAVAALTREDLHREIQILEDLRDRARRLLDAGEESKFGQLRAVLEAPEDAGAKWLIFSEHRDTVDYLVRRLEALGYSGQVTQIHGGMDWRERESAMERFRAEGGARFLIASDAAGEGINLQFCHLMVNYDIPWNPARLEQRMGRIHRYGQQREVRIVNLVSRGTREGRVLAVLLEKLDAIRQELDSDKVFDVIGRLFEDRSLRDHLRSLVTGDDEAEAVASVGGAASSRTVRRIAEQERLVYGRPGDVATRLPRLRAEMEREQSVRLLPAYVRRFVERSAPLLGLGIWGDLDGFFSLAPAGGAAPPALLSALDALGEEERARLSVRRLPRDATGVWLHPGEPVFDALAAGIRERFGRDAARGAIFADPRAEAPYFFHLGLVSVEESVPADGRDGLFATDPPATRIRGQKLVGLGQDGDGPPIQEPVERMLLLDGIRDAAPGAIPLAGRAAPLGAEADQQLRAVAEEWSETHRGEVRRESAERARRIAITHDLEAAELARRRTELRKRRGQDPEALAAIRTEQKELPERRERALEEAAALAERIRPGEARMLAHALVVPMPDAAEARDEPVEEIAVRIASEWEIERRGRVDDVSKPAKARARGFTGWPGFDLVSTRPDGERRHIEVKGRAGRGGIQIQRNEWRQAMHLGKNYWIYAVFDCGTPQPTLLRVQDPWETLFANERSTAVFSISAAALQQAAEANDPA